MTEKLDTSNRRLMQLLGFDADDLRANQTGQLSDRQRSRLLAIRRRVLLINLAILLVVIFVAALLIFLGGRGSPILTLVGIGLTLLNALVMGFFVRSMLRLTADLQAGEVETLNGKAAHTVRVMARRATLYIVRIGEREIVVDQSVFESFASDARYRVYRAPRSGVLLAAEAVRV